MNKLVVFTVAMFMVIVVSSIAALADEAKYPNAPLEVRTEMLATQADAQKAKEGGLGINWSVDVFEANLTSQGYRIPGPMVETNLRKSFLWGYTNLWYRWGSRQAKNDEIDYTLGRLFQVFGFKVDFSLTYWDMLRSANDWWDASIVIGKQVSLFQKDDAFFYLDFDYVEPAKDGEGGVYAELGVKYVYNLNEKLSIYINPWVLQDSGTCGGEAASIMGSKAWPNLRVDNGLNLSLPGIVYTSPTSGGTLSDGRKSGVIFHLIGLSGEF